MKINYEQVIDYSKVISVVLFVDKSMLSESQINLQNFKGILIYTKTSDDRLKTTVFSKSLNNYETVEELNSVTNAVSTNDIYSIAKIYKKSNAQFLTSIEFVTVDELYKRYATDN